MTRSRSLHRAEFSENAAAIGADIARDEDAEFQSLGNTDHANPKEYGEPPQDGSMKIMPCFEATRRQLEMTDGVFVRPHPRAHDLRIHSTRPTTGRSGALCRNLI